MPRFKLNVHTLEWIKTNHLINSTRDTVLRECVDEIIKSFGGIKEFLFFITKQHRNSDTKLKSMHEIVQKQTIKSDNNNNTITKQLVFSSLHSDCIGHMCGFLNKKDIRRFKLSSRQIAINCLQEMKKVSIGIFNANYLLADNNLYNLQMTNMIKSNRYPLGTRYSTLCDKWENEYNIPTKHQFIFGINSQPYSIKNNEAFRDGLISKRCNYMLCDRTKMVIYTNKEFRKYNSEIDTYEKIRKFQLLILEYFDISQQKTYVVQFILIKRQPISTQIIFEYIQNKFILLDDMCNNWYTQLKCNLNQMDIENNCNIDKLCFYQQCFDNKYVGSIHENKIRDLEDESLLLTFQLNFRHPWFTTTKVFDKIKLKCTEEMDVFQIETDKFFQDIICFTVCFEGNPKVLKSTVQMFHDLNNNIGKVDLDSMVQRVIGGDVKFKVNKKSKSEVLRHKISRTLFGGIIEAKHIEIFDRRKNKIQWGCKLSKHGSFIYYSVVLYNAQSFN